jgi:hypothetical protein
VLSPKEKSLVAAAAGLTGTALEENSLEDDGTLVDDGALVCVPEGELKEKTVGDRLRGVHTVASLTVGPFLFSEGHDWIHFYCEPPRPSCAPV